MQRRTTTSAIVGFLAIAFAASWIAANQNTQKGLGNRTSERADVVYLGSGGVVFQDRYNSCGVAALIMVFDHYGIKSTQRKLDQRGRLNSWGASLLTLKELARAGGLEAEGMRLRIEDLPRIQLPAILFLENHHFIVLDSVDGGGSLFVRDPAVGRLKIPPGKAINSWKGTTLVLIQENH